LQEVVEQLRNSFDVHQAAVDNAAADAAEARVGQLQQQLEQTQAALRSKEYELEAAQIKLDSAGQKEQEELQRLQVGVHRGVGLCSWPAL
jgi:multidrug resistance efflux pump